MIDIIGGSGFIGTRLAIRFKDKRLPFRFWTRPPVRGFRTLTAGSMFETWHRCGSRCVAVR
jgi:nucleoside-diphosphate-sugar epimerase